MKISYNEKTRSVTFRCPETLFKWIVKQGKGATTSVAIVKALQASKAAKRLKSGKPVQHRKKSVKTK